MSIRRFRYSARMHSDEPASQVGRNMYQLVEELYPICRSITGNGVRATLDTLGRRIPVEVVEVASGTPVLDWTVPLEWNIRDAFIADGSGQRVVDFTASNLHVVSYSIPTDRHMSLTELRPHLHSLPAQPEVIPYRTSYYDETWGFCLTQRQARRPRRGGNVPRRDRLDARSRFALVRGVRRGRPLLGRGTDLHSCLPSRLSATTTSAASQSR